MSGLVRKREKTTGMPTTTIPATHLDYHTFSLTKRQPLMNMPQHEEIRIQTILT
jgi:hypothetical protein